MPKQKKSEELLAENENLIAELDKPVEPPVPDPENPQEEESIETPEVREDVEQEKELEKEPDKEPQATPSIDYKKKFSDSSREAQKVVAKNRKINQAIDEATEIPEPTDEELKSEYSEYDLLDDTTKRIARDSFISKRRFELISKARVEGKKIEKWDDEVNKFVENPETLIAHPELEGKVDDFKSYANEESNNSVPFKVLVGSFLHEQSKMVKPKSKGSMFPQGSGGSNEKPKPKSDKISVAESELLRKTNFNEYKRILREGKIDNTVN